MDALNTCESLDSFVRSMNAGSDYVWCKANYRQTIRSLISYFGARTVCEVGGGRSPTFGVADVQQLGVDYIVNDISQSELDRAPAEFRKVCFDVSGEQVPEEACGQYDVVFSILVMEHVRDARRTYTNINKMLRPGGVFFHFHPLFYAVPFVVNRLLPEQIGAPLLQMIKKNRTPNQFPKFPAYYSYCKIDHRTINMLQEVGFSEVYLLPFYGHHYYDGMPGLRDLARAYWRLTARHDVQLLASYAYAMGRK